MKKTEIISEGKNELIQWWSDTLSQENNKITYLEHIFLRNGQELESWIEFEDNYNDELTFPLLKNYLLTLNKNKIEKLKLYLKKLKVNFKYQNWDSWENI